MSATLNNPEEAQALSNQVDTPSVVSGDSITIFEDYYKDDKGVWYRWKLPNEEKWHVKLTAFKDLPYVRYRVLSKVELKRLQQETVQPYTNHEFISAETTKALEADTKVTTAASERPNTTTEADENASKEEK